MEKGIYDKKICMLYTSSIELEKEGKSVERQILVSENVAQKVFFVNLTFYLPVLLFYND